LNALTGLSTPPGMTSLASVKRILDLFIITGAPFKMDAFIAVCPLKLERFHLS
jgi:hypothetical protein